MSEIVVDEDHNHAYGNEKALSYKVKVDEKLVLNFEKYAFQIPKRLEGRLPDTLHVVQGKIAFSTNFASNGKIELSKSNLEGNGREPFTRFAGEFMVVIGFSIGSPYELAVTWLAMFKNEIKDEERAIKGLGENAEFNDFMFLALHYGTFLIKDGGGPLIPIAVWISDEKRNMERFLTERLEDGRIEAMKYVYGLQNVERYAIAFDGYITMKGTKYDAIFVTAGERGAEKATVMCQRYRPKTPQSEFELIGLPMFLGHEQNLLNH